MYCINLTAITIPESVTAIGDGAFWDCRRLSSIHIPAKVTNIGSKVLGLCRSLTSITVAKDNIVYDSRENSNAIIETSSNSLISGCSTTFIPESVTKIGNDALSGCEFTTITLPACLESIGDYSFYSCSKLTSITIPENVTSIGNYAFLDCSSLTSIIIPENVTNISYGTCDGCSNLTSITIPKNVTNIESNAFLDCSSLSDVYCHAKAIPSTAGEAFKGSNISNATLHVPASALEAYMSTAPWSNFGKYESLETSIPAASITLSQSSVIMTEGGALTLIATVKPDDATDKSITWRSSDEDVAIVNSKGKVVAMGVGTATITATANDGSGVSASCEVNVVEKQYTVTFITDNVVIATYSLKCGDSIVIPEAPEKEGYTFNGWGEVADSVPANDLTYEGSYSINSYLLTYTVGGEVVKSDSVAYGTAITAFAEPTKEGYTFSGWSNIPETMPAKDVTISGIFTINKYLVTFKIGDEVIASDSLEYGAAIIAPEAPEKEGYTFEGWGEIPKTVPACDVIIKGKYSANEYLLSFIIDGSLYEMRRVKYNEEITSPDIAEKEGYTLVWENWIDKMPAKDYSIRGKHVAKVYTITYVVDDEIVQIDSVAYGTAITIPEEPTKEGYTFSGWREVPKTMPAKDVTIGGIFTINKYLVTFKIGDEVIASDSLEYMSAIVVPEAPEKEGHTFEGWGEVAKEVPAHDVTYEGSYSVNSYLLTYTVDGEVVKSDSVAYGTAITALAEPEKEGYTFSGWIGLPETMPAKDATISGIFTINKYLVTFKIGDEVIASDSLEYDAFVIVPEAPEKEGYTFDGWGDVEKDVPAHDLTYEGSYTVNTYKVYYYVGDELVHTAEVAYGEAIPEYVYEPTEEGYTFLGWIGDTYETMPAHDVTYIANIDDAINNLMIDNGQLTIYDLQGRKVLNTENLKGGIYIINGKQVLIK